MAQQGIGCLQQKEGAMKAGPTCQLRLGTFDSPDYWTDPALMPEARPRGAQGMCHHVQLVKTVPNSFPKTKPPPKAGVPKNQRECDLVSTP